MFSCFLLISILTESLNPGALAMQSLLLSNAEWRPLLDALTSGSPKKGIYAELEAQTHLHDQVVTTRYVLQVHSDFAFLSEPEQRSVIHHEWNHALHFEDAEMQLKLKQFPPAIRRAFLEWKAYEAEMNGPTWLETSPTYRQNVMRRKTFYRARVQAWVRGKEPFGAISLAILHNFEQPPADPKQYLSELKDGFVSALFALEPTNDAVKLAKN
ncbi:MAG: hypothetical protein H6510_08145 [Acidobacteria bacterium]|nr:hypothetical protein [Acidobacteriota bacterium]MCB9397770.1 hypothetical protein [Acidobacteriota bacterium]